MKFAVLSDIHGNLEALEVVINDIENWSPDFVVVAGDIINRGPYPKECLDIILEKEKLDGWLVTIGNHEKYVIDQGNHDPNKSVISKTLYQDSLWTYNQLNGNIQHIINLPFAFEKQINPLGTIRITHASMLGLRGGIFPNMSDEKILERIGKGANVFCAGHTHIPIIRFIGNTMVVNAGSVGLPFDSNKQASYAQIWYSGNHWHASIKRLSYDVSKTEEGFFKTGFIEKGGPLARLMLCELKQARSHLYQWTSLYRDRVVSGDISFQQAVLDYIHRFNLDAIAFND